MLDVLGTRLSQLQRASRDAVLARHPRLHMKRCLVEILQQRARGAPRSRIAVLAGLVFFRGVRSAPFAQ